jgi:hypothetical protein
VLLTAGLIAVVVAFVLAASMAARRSASVFDRALTHARATDTFLEVPDEQLADQVAALDLVEDSAVLIGLALFPDVDGYIPVLADRDGRWMRSVDRVKVLAGALPPIDDPDAIVVAESTARLLGLNVGDAVPMESLSRAEADRAETEEFEFTFEGPTITMRVAAIVRPPSFDADPQGQALIITTPASLERLRDEVPTFGVLLAVRLQPDATLAGLADAVSHLPGGDGVVRDVVGTGGFDAVRAALRTAAFGLAALALVAALAGLAAGGQGVARLALPSADTAQIYAAVGLRPRERALAAFVPSATAIGLGVGLGGGLAPFLAPRLVGGLATGLEPALGMSVDWAVMVPGMTAALALLLTIGIATAAAPERAGAGLGTGDRNLPRLATRLGLPAPTVAGLTLLASRSGRPVPVRQALVGGAIGVVGVIGVSVFGASLDRALDDPLVYGWGWDASVGRELDATPGELDRRGVSDAALVTYDIAAHLNGEPLTAVSVATERGVIEPVVVRGRLPVRLDEVLVGEQTLDDLGLEIGGRADLRGPAGTAPVTIVGTTVLPSADDPLPAARGVVIDAELVVELAFETGYRQLAVRVDGDAREVFSDLTEGDGVTFPKPPVEVGRLDEVRGYPTVLAAFLAILAATAVAHALTVTVRRRRRELGMLRTLGFTRRQARHAVMAQAEVVVVVALVIGIPLGVVAGRLTWRLVTDSIGLPFAPAMSVPDLLVVVLAVAGVAGLAAVVSARSAGRIGPAEALRAE